ncbi:MAG TPA: disulfide isomerase DsbC N-terminal domain-containing protein, partial [Casimicrobium sp.]|nr:disulfide isomerase DsbC N-terminal domain-containing protein [Casimicrobium sp.]
MKRSLTALFFTSILLVACNAQQPPAGTVLATSAVTNANVVSPAKLAEVQKTLEERFKGAPVKGVRAAVFPGLFEAMVGDDMIYFDEKLGHF